MKIGNDVKIFLDGESPWGVITDIDIHKIKVKITSKLFHELSEIEQAQFMKREWSTVEKIPCLHGKKQGDEFWCKKFNSGVMPLLNVRKD